MVRRAIEHSLSDGLGGHFVDVSGLKIIYDRSKPSGRRVLLILADDGKGNYKPLDLGADYKMAMNHYNFEGGEDYDFKGATNIVRTKVRMAQVLTDYLRKHGTVGPQKPNRIVCVREGLLKLKDENGKKTLVLKEMPSSARISIVGGTGPGISTIYNAFPVPLANAQVLKTGLRGSESGSLELKQADKFLSSYRATGSKGKVEASWLCVVAHPARNEKDNTVIAYPISVE
jgi:hypothetical protein